MSCFSGQRPIPHTLVNLSPMFTTNKGIGKVPTVLETPARSEASLLIKARLSPMAKARNVAPGLGSELQACGIQKDSWQCQRVVDDLLPKPARINFDSASTRFDPRPAPASSLASRHWRDTQRGDNLTLHEFGSRTRSPRIRFDAAREVVDSGQFSIVHVLFRAGTIPSCWPRSDVECFRKIALERTRMPH